MICSMDEKEDLPVFGRNTITGLIACWFFGGLALAWALPDVDKTAQPVLHDALSMSVFYLPPTLWLLGFLWWRKRTDLGTFLGTLPTPRRWLAWSGVGLGLATSAIGAFWLLWFPLSFVAPGFVDTILNLDIGMFPTYAADQRGLYAATLATAVVIVIPVIEEAIFRGVIMRWMAERWGVTSGVVVSSVVFGVIHFDPIGAFVFGVIMSGLYFQTRTLWVPIFCHALNNALAIGTEIVWYLIEGSSSTTTIEEFRSWTPWMASALVIAAVWLWIYGRRLIRTTDWQLSRLP